MDGLKTTLQSIIINYFKNENKAEEKKNNWRDVDRFIEQYAFDDADNLKLWSRSVRFNYAGPLQLTMRRLLPEHNHIFPGYQIQLSTE